MVRKLAHGVLSVKVSRTYVPYQDLEVKAMLMGLLESPGNFLNHIRRYTTSLTTQMAFGYRTPESDDKNLLEMFGVRGNMQFTQFETVAYDCCRTLKSCPNLPEVR